MNAVPDRKVFNVSEYHKMIDAGVFIGNSNYELIEGEIVKKMVVGDYHISCVNRLTRLFNKLNNDDFILSIQNPVVIDDFSEPEPDVTILKFREDFYASGKAAAKDVLLLIEVSDSTVNYDRSKKVALYAAAGIDEVWLLNLPRRILEAYSEPQNSKYKVVKKIGKGEAVTPKFMPEMKLKVADMMG